MLRVSVFISFFIIFSFHVLATSKNENWAGSIVLVTDFDGTLMSENKYSPWKPIYFLEKIQSLHSSIQYAENQEAMPLSFPVTVGEFYKMEFLLGTSEKIKISEPIHLKPDIALPDRPLVIHPGYYTINEKTSYARFRANPNKNFLLEDLSYALSRQKQTVKAKNFYGLSYNLFRWLMRNQTKGEVAIHTARSQSHSDFDAFFNELQKNNHLEQVNHQFRVYPLSALSSRILGRSLGEKKSKAVKLEAKQLAQKPLKKGGQGFLHVDKKRLLSGEREQKHLLVVAEDHPEFSYELFKTAQRLSQERLYRNKIKFVFLHAGDMKYINDDKVFDGHRAFVFNNGFHRPITDKELKEELKMSVAHIQRFYIKHIALPENKTSRQTSETAPKTQEKASSNCQKSFTGKKAS